MIFAKISQTFIVLLLISNINCNISQDAFFDMIQNWLEEGKIFCEKFYNAQNNNSTCCTHLNEMFDNIRQPWVLQVLDAWGKIPSGILYGNLNDFGNFDQCLNIIKEFSSDDIFKGQYCLANIGFDLNARKNIIENFTHNQINSIDRLANGLNVRAMAPSLNDGNSINIGMCIPNSCTSDFFEAWLDQIIKVNSLNIACFPQKEIKYSAADIFGITFFSIFGGLLVFSTGYDLIMKHLNKSTNANLLAFSVKTNGKKIFNIRKTDSAEVMECLNGIRVLSITWVVYGHTYFMYLFAPMTNKIMILRMMEDVYNMLILSATLAVDSFLLISGLLVAWSMLRHLDLHKGRINIFMMYLHRYLRLTPPLAAAILFYVTIYKYLGNGPIRNILNYSIDDCVNYWPFALLYVQNYVNPDNICLGHSWYLSVDMQLFILSPILLYPLWRWKNKFIWVIPILIMLSMACTFTVYMINDGFRSLVLTDVQARMKKTYLPTHSRYGTYMIGILLGYLLHNLKGKIITLPKPVIVSGWIISIASIFTIIFAPYSMWNGENTTALEYAFHESFSRVCWSICLAWIIFACVTGYGGPMNWLLTLPQWQPLSKLSYSLYIVHLPFQMLLTASLKNPTYFSHWTALHQFWGDFGLSLTICLLWTLTFESPIVTLEKMIFKKSAKTKKAPEIRNGENV